MALENSLKRNFLLIHHQNCYQGMVDLSGKLKFSRFIKDAIQVKHLNGLYPINRLGCSR
jgi:hypothetical protein